MKVYVPAEEELRPRELLIITDDGGWDVDLPRRVARRLEWMEWQYQIVANEGRLRVEVGAWECNLVFD